MKKVVIVSSTAMPGQPIPMGFESLNPFKKTRADILKKNLEKVIQEEQLDFRVERDITYGDIPQLKADGANFFIVTPFASDYVELNLLGENEYVVLTGQEYDEGDVSRIVHKIK